VRETEDLTMLHSTPTLRRLLLADGALCLGFGLMLAAGAGLIGGITALPEALLRVLGLVLLPWGAWVLWLGTRDVLSRAAVWTVIVVNALWVADSLLLLASGWVAPNGLGISFVLGQAVLVGAIAAAQWAAARRGKAAAVTA
jgi:uncharacterized protein YjeT (DUF2065 family)